MNLMIYKPLPIKRSTRYGNNYWEDYSIKMSREVRMFSDLEYDNWILIETDNQVESFCEQPLRIRVEWEGSIMESILDMWIRRRDGSECFIEVKYSSELDPSHKNFSERSYKQTKAQQKWCQENGFQYEIRTEKVIRGNTMYLNNLKTILPYVKQRVKTVETDCYKVLKRINREWITVKTIEKQLPEMSKQRIIEVICRMIYDGTIESNIYFQPFDFNTEVRLYDEN